MTKQPDFDTINWNSEKCQKLWQEVQEHFGDEGRVWTHDLVENQLGFNDGTHERTGWSKSTVRRILTDMRRTLKKQGFINVEEEPGESNQDRKYWVIER